LSPRVGVTYALDEDYKTVLRGSFNKYHGQLVSYLTAWDNPIGNRAYLQYDWVDANGDDTVQVNEVDFSQVTASGGLDPNCPTCVDEPVDKIDPDFKADVDYEAIVGVDHELKTDLGVGFAFTWRRSYNVWTGRNTDYTPWIGVTRANYTQGEPVTTDGYTSTPWILNDGVLDRPEVTGGVMLQNRDDYNREFRGFEFTLSKRLSNRWMARGAFSINNWKENWTGGQVGSYPNPSRLDDEPSIDGGQKIRQTGGSGRTYYMTSGWQFNVSGLYQLGYGLDLSANFFGRQGYPQPYYHRINLGPVEGRERVLAVSDVNEIRLDNLYLLDLRLAKTFQYERLGFTLAAEIFNLLNAGTSNAKVVDLSSGTFGRTDEILAPRIMRLVAKFKF
jgi:hypothetical protein